MQPSSVCVCVCLSPFAKRALFGLCLTSYLLPSPRGALVSVWPCRAILPLVPTHQTPIGRPLHALHRSRPYRRGWEKKRHINQTNGPTFFFFFIPSRADVLPVSWQIVVQQEGDARHCGSLLRMCYILSTIVSAFIYPDRQSLVCEQSVQPLAKKKKSNVI